MPSVSVYLACWRRHLGIIAKRNSDSPLYHLLTAIYMFIISWYVLENKEEARYREDNPRVYTVSVNARNVNILIAYWLFL